MGQIDFKFKKWPEYQGESKRYERTTWFRMENTIWMNALWDELTDSEFRAFVFLISYVSQKSHKEGHIALALGTLQRMSGISSDTFRGTVRKLCALGIAEITENNVPVQSPCEHGASTVQSPCYETIRNDTKRYDTKLKGAAPAPPVQAASVSIDKKSDRAEDARQFIATYVRAYQARHGPTARPECLSDGKTVGIIRNFLKNRALDRACDLVQVYLQMDDPWFEKNHHDLVTFTMKINQIGLALTKGRDPARPMTFIEYMEEKNGTNRLQRASGKAKDHVPKGILSE